MTAYLVALGLCMLFSFLFSLTEMAFINIDRAQFHHRLSEKNPRALLIRRLTESPSFLVTCFLLGIVIANQLATILVTHLAYPHFQSHPRVMDGIIVAFGLFVVLFLDGLPQIMALRNPLGAALLFAPLVQLFMTVFSPLIALVAWFPRQMVGEHTRSFLEMKPLQHKDILLTLEGGTGPPKSEEQATISAVLKARDVKGKDIMTPRSQIVFLRAGDSFGKVLETFRNTQYSRLPVVESSLDDCTRFLHVKDLFRLTGGPPRAWLAFARRQPSFPADTSVFELLKRMRGVSYLALLRDPYGRVVGMVTMEDLVEYLKGEIEDEYD
ncbi:MAG: CNNM domain-containing protein [bacterium]